MSFPSSRPVLHSSRLASPVVCLVFATSLLSAGSSGAETPSNRLTATQQGPSQIDSPEADRSALITLYIATNGDQWLTNTGWKDPPLQADGFGEDHCNWFGITCESGRVVSIFFVRNGLVGVIPPEVGDLTMLTDLLLVRDQLTGPIPPELGDLTNLTMLNLSDNILSGPVPKDLGRLTNLTILALARNLLSGPIPPEVGNLIELTFLGLLHNELSGPIPPELAQLTDLERLDLFNNHLSGTIPPELGSLESLQRLGLGNNHFTGSIPPELGDLDGLTGLNLDHNHLSGSIPVELAQLGNLTKLDLSANDLDGEVPSEIATLPEGLLDLRENRVETVEAGLSDELDIAQRGLARWQTLQKIVAVYPQLAIGGGFEVVLSVSSNLRLPWNGIVDLDGGLWPQDRNWQLDGEDMTGQSSFSLELERRGSRTMILSSPAAEPLTGWLSIRAAGDSPAQSIAASFSYNLIGSSGLEDSVGVGPSLLTTRFHFPVERSSSVLTGVAVRSVSDSVFLFLYDPEGTEVARTTIVEDGAQLVGEMFEGLPADFRGSVDASSNSPFFMTVLRVNLTSGGRVQLTSIPATETLR